MRHSPSALLLASALLAALGPAHADGASWSGAYELVGGREAAEATIATAVDEALLQLPALVRPFAQERLLKATTVCERYEIVVDEASWRSVCNGGPPLEGPTDGSTFDLRRDGGSVPTTLVRQGASVQARFHGELGERTSTWTFDATGLRLDATIASDHLDQPVAWTLRYVRR